MTVQGHPRIRFERNRFAGSPFPAQAAVGEIQAMLLDEALGTDVLLRRAGEGGIT